MMSAQHICDTCQREFTQKGGLTRHKKSKTPCSIQGELKRRKSKKTPCTAVEPSINQIKHKTDILEMSTKDKLINIFKGCSDILRVNETILGEKALRNISYLLILKLIEPHFGKDIDIDNYDYDFESHFEDNIVEESKQRLLSIVRFSKLSIEKEDDIPNLMKYLWDVILSKHPSTKNIFLKGEGFNIKNKSTYKILINKLNSINLNKTECDVLGNVYEESLQSVMVGRTLGQFFTQPSIKKLMVKLIDPQIHPDGKIDTCCDPTMGTGGFLITYLNCILQQASDKNIKPDWDFIKTEGLYGKEIEHDTYRLAVSNMLISSGYMFEQLERGDSIREPITRKFDNILANPPFGIKGLKYDDFQSGLKHEYTPIKSDNAVSLFIQAIIYMLKINGKCAIVLPDGQDLFSKTDKKLVAVREYLLKTCDLKEIIHLPSGMFTYTSIKTCVFFFVKKQEGKDVLETKIKMTKTHRESGREYKFSKDHQTTQVKFYDYNPIDETKTLLVEVPIEKIADNSYSLVYTDYRKVEQVEEHNEGIVIKTLGEVCEFLPKSKRPASYGEKQGKYNFYSSSQTCSKYCDTYDYEDECLIIGTGGTANIKYCSKFSCSADNFVIKINNDQLAKYIYYYLLINIEILQRGFIGVGIQHISKEYVTKIKIPIPSLETQQEIVKYLDFIYEKANKTSNEKIDELKMLNEFCLNNQKIFGENDVKTLGEVCIINPENMKAGTYPEINYIDIASVKGGQILEIQKLVNEFPSRAKRIIKQGDILYSSVRPNLKGYVYISDIIENGIASTGFAQIRVNDENIISSKYLYYILTCDCVTVELVSKAKGAQYPAVSFDDFESIKIPIPSLERQKEIIDYCESNDALIKALESEIEKNKHQAQLFISSALKCKAE